MSTQRLNNSNIDICHSQFDSDIEFNNDCFAVTIINNYNNHGQLVIEGCTDDEPWTLLAHLEGSRSQGCSLEKVESVRVSNLTGKSIKSILHGPTWIISSEVGKELIGNINQQALKTFDPFINETQINPNRRVGFNIAGGNSCFSPLVTVASGVFQLSSDVAKVTLGQLGYIFTSTYFSLKNLSIAATETKWRSEQGHDKLPGPIELLNNHFIEYSNWINESRNHYSQI